MFPTYKIDAAFEDLLKRAIFLAKARQSAYKAKDTAQAFALETQLKNLLSNASAEHQRMLFAVMQQEYGPGTKASDFEADCRNLPMAAEHIVGHMVGKLPIGSYWIRGWDQLNGVQSSETY